MRKAIKINGTSTSDINEGLWHILNQIGGGGTGAGYQIVQIPDTDIIYLVWSHPTCDTEIVRTWNPFPRVGESSHEYPPVKLKTYEIIPLEWGEVVEMDKRNYFIPPTNGTVISWYDDSGIMRPSDWRKSSYKVKKGDLVPINGWYKPDYSCVGLKFVTWKGTKIVREITQAPTKQLLTHPSILP